MIRWGGILLIIVLGAILNVYISNSGWSYPFGFLMGTLCCVWHILCDYRE